MTDRSTRPCLCGAQVGQSHDPTCYWHDASYDRPTPPPERLFVFHTWHGNVRFYTADKDRSDSFARQHEMTPVEYVIGSPS